MPFSTRSPSSIEGQTPYVLLCALYVIRQQDFSDSLLSFRIGLFILVA